MVTNYSGEMSFQTFKRIKNELNGRSVPGYVVHTKHSVHSDQGRQTNCNEFLDGFVMRKAGTKSFHFFTVLCSALLDSMIVAFSF